MNTFYFLVQQTMFFSIPLLIVALGGMFSERSGVVNIALEGIMILGAFAGILFINSIQQIIPVDSENMIFWQRNGQRILLLAVVISMLAGTAVGALHAFASINLKANQIISGTAINLLAPALAIYAARTLRSVQGIPFSNQFFINSVPLLGDIPVLGQMLFRNTFITTYLGFLILAVSVFLLYKTRFGLRLRACGEHPQAADSVGINVYAMRWAGVLISGALAGLGGLVFVIPTSVEFNPEIS
ncbi:MAG: ABC transporter permease, partial [Treponema sp.]|nr:ABC transporter permease [Treponema sp.]